MMELTSKDDVVVGCITGYNFEAIKPWVNSLDRSGFDGKKVVLCYNIGKDVLDELTIRNYSVLAFKLDENGNASYKDGQPFSIVVERFFHLWAMLSTMKGSFRYLLHTDVKDVIFQQNPSLYLHSIFDSQHQYKIVAASESIIYKDENWGRENLKDSFGEFIYEAHKNNVIVNAGTLAGKFDTLIDLFLNVYMVSVGAKIHNPDQAAVNILLSKSPYKEVTFVSEPFSGWACQAGTTNDPNKMGEYASKLINKDDSKSFWSDEHQMVCNSIGCPFYLVHQYDRVPHWKSEILRKYS